MEHMIGGNVFMCMHGVTGKEDSKEKPDPEGIN